MKNTNKNFYLSKKSGSVLVFSLFIMMISLIIGISLMATSSVGRKSTFSSAKSVNSYQVADSGIEYAYRKIREYRWDRPGHDLVAGGSDNIAAAFGTGENGCNNEPTPPAAVVTGNANGGQFKIYFYGSDGSLLSPCNRDLILITKIKAVGTYNGITRSVEATADFADL